LTKHCIYLGRWIATPYWTINHLMVYPLGWISGEISIDVELHVTCGSNIIFISFLSKFFKKLWRMCRVEEYQNPSSVTSQRIFVIGGVGGGSLACTFALGFFFIWFNKHERHLPKPDCSSTTSISPNSCYVQIIIQNLGWREKKTINSYRLWNTCKQNFQ
jgi:hypothetical protein